MCKICELHNFSANAKDIKVYLYPGACIIQLIMALIFSFRNKLECLSLASLSCLVSV